MDAETKNNRLIIYQPEEGVTSLEVKLENETVWLTQSQMSELFNKSRKTITEHINNIYKEAELQRFSTSRKFQLVQNEGGRIITRNVEHYNLDVIISVGYRVKSKQGTQFRIWANKILKDYLLKGHVLNERVDRIERKLCEYDKKFELIIEYGIPQKEGIFFDGHIFDAYAKAVSFIKEARKSIILIDNYIDETVLLMLSKRRKGVKVVIYTDKLTKTLQLDLEKHNAQYEPIEIKVFKKSHDRFLITDSKNVYHIGASLKDLGKKLFGFSKININPQIILNYILGS